MERKDLQGRFVILVLIQFSEINPTVNFPNYATIRSTNYTRIANLSYSKKNIGIINNDPFFDEKL